MLLKVVLFAYSLGIVGSRNIECACRDNEVAARANVSVANVKRSGRSQHVTFIALSGDSQPHFTTIAGFVSTLGDDIVRVFTQILFARNGSQDHARTA